MLNVDIVRNVVPLADQFAVDPPKSVPDAVKDRLFTAPDTACFAVLDGARMTNLPERLAASGLPHECLFQGETGDAAPWIVQLAPDHSFTRALFTRSDAPWDMWDIEPGIFLCSTASLTEMRAHLRKFTQVKSSAGATLFFRFWDTNVAQVYFPGIRQHTERCAQIFTLPTGAQMRLLCKSAPEEMLDVTLAHPPEQTVTHRSITFDATEERLMDEVSYRALERRLADWLPTEYPDTLGKMSLMQLDGIARHVVRTGRQFDLKMKEDFAFLAQMMVTLGGYFVEAGYPQPVLQLLHAQDARKTPTLVKAFAGLQAKTPQGGLMQHWPQVRAWMTALPDDACVTPAAFSTFVHRFLNAHAQDLPAALHSTKARLRRIALPDQRQEGKAVLLSLIHGACFFDDPFKPWAGQPIPEAIESAWSYTLR